MDRDFAADGPITPENWGQLAQRPPQRQRSEDTYKWLLNAGDPWPLERQQMTLMGRTLKMRTWGQKLGMSPRKLHDALVSGMREGKTIREVLVVDLKADIALILGSGRRKRTSSVKGVQQTRNDHGGLLRERLSAIEKRRQGGRRTSQALTESRGRPSLSSLKPDGE